MGEDGACSSDRDATDRCSFKEANPYDIGLFLENNESEIFFDNRRREDGNDDGGIRPTILPADAFMVLILFWC